MVAWRMKGRFYDLLRLRSMTLDRKHRVFDWPNS